MTTVAVSNFKTSCEKETLCCSENYAPCGDLYENYTPCGDLYENYTPCGELYENYTPCGDLYENANI
jgi:hypothetical protein